MKRHSSLRLMAGALLGLAILGPAAESSSFSHIKTFENIWTGTEADIPFLKAHYDWLTLNDSLAVAYRNAGGTAWLWVYRTYNYIPWDAPDEWAHIRQWAATQGLTPSQWEDMFVHFSTDTVYRPNQESSTSDASREDSFESVFVYNGVGYTDRTADAYSGSSFRIGDNLGWILYVGYEEPFKEVNFTISTPASADWAGVWEYWNGSAWAPLNPTDGTNDMTRSGKVERLPPPMASWTRCAVNGSTKWWWRLRTTAAGTTRPVVAGGGLKGQNYVTFGGGYYRVPGWDSANDANGDGVRDTNSNPGATAIFRYQSRVSVYWLKTYYPYMGDANYRSWFASYAKEVVEAGIGGSAHHYDSLFLDDAFEYFWLHNVQSGSSTIENAAATWVDDSIALLTAVKATVGPDKIVFLNTSERTSETTERFIDAVDGFLGESYINFGACPRRRLDAVVDRDARGKHSLVHASHSLINDDAERTMMFSLAAFYLMKGERTHYRFGMDGRGPEPNHFHDHFYGAIEYDVGQPKGPYYVLHQEDDPSSNDPWGIAYMYAREYDNILAVTVPMPSWDSTFIPSYTAALPSYATGQGTSNRYQRMRSDATIEATAIAQITLRNGEGALLVKSDLSPPAVAVSKAPDRATAAPSDVITYTITYRNDSSETIRNAVLTDAIPEHTAYVPNSTKLNGATVTPDPYANGQITVPIGAVAAGDSGTVMFQVIVQ
ncbi:MAG: DUF11 domain-containing protein [Armatimonadota bacterium]|nr:MAG: DUF11 domain-containing protein [Armatimonadota bacterium]